MGKPQQRRRRFFALSGKKAKIIGVAAAGAIVLGAVLLLLFPPVDWLLAAGRYQRAYQVASSEKKEAVFAENLAAYLCEDVAQRLKAPSSFVLYEVWYDTGMVILRVGGTNAYGGMTSSYFDYDNFVDPHNIMAFHFGACIPDNDFELEDVYSYDNSADQLEKRLRNSARRAISRIIEKKELALPKEAVDRINKLFSQGKLNEIKTIS